MNKKLFIILTIIAIIIVTSMIYIKFDNKKNNIKKLTATVLNNSQSKLTVQDSQNIIYTFNIENDDINNGDNIIIEYTGVLDKNIQEQTNEVISYTIATFEEENVPSDWMDKGIFSNYYDLAYNEIKKMTLDEKIGQILLIRYPDNAIENLKKFNVGGFVFYEKDFKDKKENEVKNMIKELQNSTKIPLLTAVDEEGGKVTRISSNPNLVESKFKSPSELYNLGGFELIKNDTIEKSKILYNLGLNLNLAPVVDVSSSPNSYIYERTLKKDAELTATYAKTVIEASKGTNVSYTLKHFPGYGDNVDTHIHSSVDNRSYDYIVNNDLPPFEAGIKAGAEAVLISHNIINNIDPDNPASLSPSVHNLLRNKLGFTGIIITDDLDMSATSSIDNYITKAILAGNDLIIVSDYENAVKSIKTSIEDNTISEELIDKLAFRVISWKYYKGLMFINQK